MIKISGGGITRAKYLSDGLDLSLIVVDSVQDDVGLGSTVCFL